MVLFLFFIESNKILYHFSSVSSTASVKSILESKVSLFFICTHFILVRKTATDVQEIHSKKFLKRVSTKINFQFLITCIFKQLFLKSVAVYANSSIIPMQKNHIYCCYFIGKITVNKRWWLACLEKEVLRYLYL